MDGCIIRNRGGTAVLMRITINGEFPGINEFIDANRVHHGRWNKGNAMKQASQKQIMAQLPRWHTDKPVTLHYRFFCSNKKRDLDNIAGYFHKVFQDALVASGVITDDGWRNIRGFSDEFFIDRRRPRIEIEVMEVEG